MIKQIKEILEANDIGYDHFNVSVLSENGVLTIDGCVLDINIRVQHKDKKTYIICSEGNDIFCAETLEKPNGDAESVFLKLVESVVKQHKENK